MSTPLPTLSEPTEQGEQTLVPGVAPITVRERLAVLFAAPLTPRKPQRPMNIGPLACPWAGHRPDPREDARNQLDLF